MINFNLEHATQLQNRATNDVVKINSMLAVIGTMSDDTIQALFADAYDFRMWKQYPNIKLKLIDAAHHAAWSAFFGEYDIYSTMENREYNAAVAPYTFADSYKRSYYGDVKALTPFTVDAARDFFNAHIVDTKARRKQATTAMLDHCGASYKNSPDKFSAKMTFRGYDAYNDASRVLLNFYRVASWLHGVDFSVKTFNLELRNTVRVDGTQVTLVDGLPITLEKSANGNATLRMSKDIAALLNGIAAYNEQGA